MQECPLLLSTPLPPSSGVCGRGKDALPLDTVSHVPTAELAAPSGGSPDSKPCFSRENFFFVSLPPSWRVFFWEGALCLAEGGLRSREGSCGGSSASSQHGSVCAAAIFIRRASSYIYPECHRSRKSWRQLPCCGRTRSGYPLYCQPSPAPTPLLQGPLLPPQSSLCPIISTVVMLNSCPCPWWGGWNQMVSKVPSYPKYSEILWISLCRSHLWAPFPAPLRAKTCFLCLN